MGEDVEWIHKSLAIGVIALFTFINLLGAFMTGKAEDIMVFIKLMILIVFVVVGFSTIEWSHLAPITWSPAPSLIAGGLMIFLAYEGFELIANTSKEIQNPQRNLPLAYYSSVIFVIILYVLIAMVAVGNVTPEQAASSGDYILAIAAKPFFGKAGFILIGIAALLSTASAINATIYGSGRTAYLIAKFGEIPRSFEIKVKHGFEGMIIIGLLGVIFAISFSLENISVAGSIGFLIIFALVNLANYKLHKETNASRLLAGFGFFLSLSAVVVLVGYNAIHTPDSLITSLIVMGLVGIFDYSYHHYKEHKKQKGKR